MPEIVTRFPVAGIPGRSRSCVPLAVRRVTTLSPSAMMSSIAKRRSGNAFRYGETSCRTLSGPALELLEVIRCDEIVCDCEVPLAPDLLEERTLAALVSGL